MANTTIYLTAKRNVVSQSEDVYLQDIATIYCEDTVIRAKANAIKIYHFQKNGENRCVISVMRMIEQITRLCSGVTVESLGEKETIIKYEKLQKKENKAQTLKMIAVCLICFIGSAFTIMAFHNDIGITGVFSRLYEMITGDTTNFHTVLEFSYAIGLALGIIIFYNHLGKRKLDQDPTPLSVEMRVYETEVDQAIVDMAEREGKIIDVDHK